MSRVIPGEGPDATIPAMPRRSIFTFAALALIATGLLAGWFTRAPSVPAVPLSTAPLVRTLQFSARVATLSRVDIGSTLTGRVLRVDATEGAWVKQGDALARLETDELQAALSQAQASETQAVARLAGLRGSGRSAALANVAQADSVLLAADAELRRTQDLIGRGFVSQARLDEAQRAAAVALAQQAGARALSAANAEKGTDIVQAQAQLAVAAAASAAARARLDQALITAPADARVLARLVQPGRALFSLALAGPLQIVAQVDERFLGQLLPGQTAAVVADAFPQQRFAAQVLSIAPLVDAQRGAIEVKFSVAEPPAFLREDMTLSVEVETARRAQALVLPIAALRGETSAAGSAEVWLSRDGRVEARQVRLGLRTLEAAEVLDGVVAGDFVLLGPAPSPGARVRADTDEENRAATRPATAAYRPGGDAGSAMSNAMGR
jgi:HlyD family secretion protein